MTDEERHRAIGMVAAKPDCGGLIQGGGGLRKVRFGVGSRGKRGGGRIIYYHSPSMPVFLLTVFAKDERDDLSRRELNRLAEVARQIARADGG